MHASNAATTLIGQINVQKTEALALTVASETTITNLLLGMVVLDVDNILTGRRSVQTLEAQALLYILVSTVI